MGFLSTLDVRPKAAPVHPEGVYQLICTRAVYSPKNKELPADGDNIKGALVNFQFKFNGKHGECMRVLNLNNPEPTCKRIALEDLGKMALAMGFKQDKSTGYIIGLDDIGQLNGKSCKARIGVGKHYQTKEFQNEVLEWIMPATSNTADTSDGPYQDISNDEHEFENDDMPF